GPWPGQPPARARPGGRRGDLGPAGRDGAHHARRAGPGQAAVGPGPLGRAADVGGRVRGGAGEHRAERGLTGPARPRRQPGSAGSLPVADVALTAFIMILFRSARWVSSLRRSRWSLAWVAARAAPLAPSTWATSVWTCCAPGKAQVTRPSTTRGRPKLASDSLTWYWVRLESSSLFAGEQLLAP